jgi:tRNA threonylcarbamoyladenosine biosynthesis protein TsaE
MEEIGYDDCFFGGGVTIVEWAEFIEELMPENTIHIRIEKDLSKGPDMRRISFE